MGVATVMTTMRTGAVAAEDARMCARDRESECVGVGVCCCRREWLCVCVCVLDIRQMGQVCVCGDVFVCVTGERGRKM